MKVLTVLALILITGFIHNSIQAQTSNPLDDMLMSPGKTPANTAARDSLTNDIIRINFAKKNAKLAMVMSALVPGSGQFYANKKAITAFIFPVIEIAAIVGILHFDKKGNDITKQYKKYVTESVTFDVNGYTYTGTRYRRDYQNAVQATLIPVHENDIYDGVGSDKFFNLDPTDTQHYFEDIGKYNKYIFGWVDWYYKYGETPPVEGAPTPNPTFVWDFDQTTNMYKLVKIIPLSGFEQTDFYDSDMRDAYIHMRSDAELQYKTSHNLTFGLVFNHIASAIDAIRVTNNINRFYLSDRNIKFNYYASVRDGNLTPMLGLNLNF